MVRSLVPFQFPMMNWERDIESAMDRWFGRENLPKVFEFSPRSNVVETEGTFEVTVELPGMTRDDFSVEIKDSSLIVTGEKKEEKEEKGKTFHKLERHYGKFQRVLPLPVPVKEEEISAEYENGVLHVVLPKTELSKPRQIEVKGS